MSMPPSRDPQQPETDESEASSTSPVAVALVVAKIVGVLVLLYLFVCSIDLLSAGFQLLGGRAAGGAFTNESLFSNPVVGLMLGIAVTVLLQSSSTSTSIVVTMVASGILPVEAAIPIIFGANIGTSVTNTLVALGQANEREVFRRAFAAATVLDVYKWLVVFVMLPIEAAFGMLYHLTAAIVHDIGSGDDDDDSEGPAFLKVITEPFTDLFVQIDKLPVLAAATNATEAKRPLLKYWCPERGDNFSVPLTEENFTSYFDEIDRMLWSKSFAFFNTSVGGVNVTTFSYELVNETTSGKCKYLFAGNGLPDSSLGETAVGVIVLVASLFSLILCLVLMVKLLQSLLSGSISAVIRRRINADLPGLCAPLTGYLAILVGAGLTVLVQSSSVFTSTLTPLAGIGIVSLERVYPLSLGSSIGTTSTGVIAAFTAEPSHFRSALQIALCHFFFNIFGILLWYPVPYMRRAPLRVAEKLGDVTASYRWFPFVYIVGMFFVLPAAVMALSLAGWHVLLAVLGPLLLLLVFVAVVNVARTTCPRCLPSCLEDWSCLPKPLRSLEPWDRGITACCRVCRCCKCCGKARGEIEVQESGKAGAEEQLRITAPAQGGAIAVEDETTIC